MLRSLSQRSFWKSFFLSGLTIAGFNASFPFLDWSYLIFVTFIPFFILVDQQPTYRHMIRWSWLTGFFLFFTFLLWLHHVTWAGLILLAIYLGSYFLFWGICIYLTRSWKVFPRGLLLASSLVALELLRTHAFSGFGWGQLGHALADQPWLIQIVEFTGVYGLTFLIVLVNFLFYQFLKTREINRSLIGTVFVLLAISIFLYINCIFFPSAEKKKSHAVTLVQGNISQEIKWDRKFWPTILHRYFHLTEQALESNKERFESELIIWPETSFPGYINEDDDYLPMVLNYMRELQTPFLFGSVLNDEGSYRNTALLYDQEANFVQRYDKKHLVPFGEYIPLRGIFPYLEDIIPIGDFNSGQEFTVFRPSFFPAFAVIICFEDTLAHLTRQFVLNGAEVLVNMTNDAWFGESRASHIHLHHAIFRAVENRRFLIRSANTGVTSSIHPTGHLSKVLSHNNHSFIDGFLNVRVEPQTTITFYTKYGDVFAYWCIICILILPLMNQKLLLKKDPKN